MRPLPMMSDPVAEQMSRWLVSMEISWLTPMWIAYCSLLIMFENLLNVWGSVRSSGIFPMFGNRSGFRDQSPRIVQSFIPISGETA